MSTQIALTDEMIRAGITRRATDAREGDLRARVSAATARVSQRRGWRVRLAQAGELRQRRATLTLAVVVVLLLVAALVIALVGSRPTPGSLGRLAYFSEGDLYVTEPGGTSPRLIWDLPATENPGAREPVWVDPETVLLSSAEDGGVFVVDVTSGAHRLLNAGSFVALSPDHRVVAIQVLDQSSTTRDRVRLIDVATGGVVGEIPGRISGYPGKWSPDGRSILAESPETIYRVDIATGERVVLASGLCCGLGPAHNPTWSPDGRQVVYVDYHPSTEQRLHADPWYVPVASAYPPPEYRDCGDRCGTLWSVDVAGGAPTRLTPEFGSETSPAFSPDGRWIAYLEEHAHDILVALDLVVIAADGSGRRLLTPPWQSVPVGSSNQSWTGFSWDPDSAGISALSSVGSLWQIKLDGRSSRIETPPLSEFAWQVVP